MRVLAVAGSTEAGKKSTGDSGSGTVTLELTPDQASAVTSQGGSVWLTLVPSEEAGR